MASASDELDEFKTTAQHSASDPATMSDALCELCLQALIIDDKLAGGAVTNDSDEETAILDLSGFTPQQWKRVSQLGFRCSRRSRGEGEGRDEFGWRLSGSSVHEESYLRESCAGNNCERSITPPKLPELTASANENCQFCSKLAELFNEQYDKSSWWNSPDSKIRFHVQYEWQELRSTEEKEGKTTKMEFNQALDCLAVIVSHPGLEYDTADVYEFEVGAEPGDCRDWLNITYNPLDTNGPASESNMEFMKSCIGECIKDHPGCRSKLSKENFIPTRLLDIRNGTAPYARLVERSEIRSELSPAFGLKYATLSYCWGDALSFKTTEQNLAQRKSGFPVHEMPAVFQDAVHLSRKLDIHFIWIDALCIIQDQRDNEDWEAESVAMTDIFAHSYITICAAVSSSCSESFLKRPTPKFLTLLFRSSLRPNISGDYTILLRGRHVSPGDVDLKHSRWSNRGWVWQEQVMAARQLIFGEEVLQFRCNDGVRLQYGLLTSHSPMALWKDSNYDWFWFSAIFEYSSRELTFAQDRLGAISGVAKFIQDSMKESGKPVEYLAGLWLNETFGKQLVWICQKPTLSYREMLGFLWDKTKYCAPSWSWASLNTGVHCLSSGLSTVSFQVIGYDLQPASSDAMVAVRLGSSITLHGKCRRTPVKPTSGIFVQGERRWSNYWESRQMDGFGSCVKFWLDWVPNYEDPEESDRQNQLHLFLLNKGPTIEMIGVSSATGLLLLPFKDSRRILYYRVGAFKVEGKCEWLTKSPECRVTIL